MEQEIFQNTPANCLLTGARIVDGSGGPAFTGSVKVEGGIIRAVTKEPAEASKPRRDIPRSAADCLYPVFDLAGAVLAPGFVDIHRHGDWLALSKEGDAEDAFLLAQGITTLVNGNCGLSAAPLGADHAGEILSYLRSVTGAPPEDVDGPDAARTMTSYMDALFRQSHKVKREMLVGCGTVCASVAGYHAGRLNEEDLPKIHAAFEEAFGSGVRGVSLGLGYVPEYAYTTDEMIRILAPMRGSGLPLVTHIRNEGDGSAAAVREVTRIAKELGVALHLSHMKSIGRRNRRVTTAENLRWIRQCREDGMEISLDVYPFTAGATHLLHVIPPSFQTNGVDAFLAELEMPAVRKELTRILSTPSEDFENIVELVGLENVSLGSASSERFRPFIGRPITEIAEALSGDPFETLYDILIAEHGEAAMFDTITLREDLIEYYSDPFCSVISDAIYPEDGRLHPRVFSSFPRFLIDFCRDDPVFSLEEAVAKMTRKPADVFSLRCGRIEAGFPADFCIFRPEELTAPATFEEPTLPCAGIRTLISKP